MQKNSINKVMLAGFIEEGPIQSSTSNGSEISTFSLSTEENYEDKNGVLQQNNQVHKCICFGRNAENANKYFGLGQFIYLEGSIRTRESDESDELPDKITEVSVSRFTFLDSPSDRKPPEPSGADAVDIPDGIPPESELPT